MAPERVIPTADTFGNDHEKDEMNMYITTYVICIFQLTTFVRLAFSCKAIILCFELLSMFVQTTKKYLFSNKFKAVIIASNSMHASKLM